jgi:hypothetical protein
MKARRRGTGQKRLINISVAREYLTLHQIFKTFQLLMLPLTKSWFLWISGFSFQFHIFSKPEIDQSLFLRRYKLEPFLCVVTPYSLLGDYHRLWTICFLHLQFYLEDRDCIPFTALVWFWWLQNFLPEMINNFTYTLKMNAVYSWETHIRFYISVNTTIN